MQEQQDLVVGPFRLDLRDARLWRGPEALPLSPKTFAVLCCLVTRAGQLVTKDALLEAVWPETAVSESVIPAAIRTLRWLLGDQARTPQFIETVYGRGYRFIAPVWAPASAAGVRWYAPVTRRRFLSFTVRPTLSGGPPHSPSWRSGGAWRARARGRWA